MLNRSTFVALVITPWFEIGFNSHRPAIKRYKNATKDYPNLSKEMNKK